MEERYKGSWGKMLGGGIRALKGEKNKERMDSVGSGTYIATRNPDQATDF